MIYACPQCGIMANVKIVIIYPPWMMKYIHYGSLGSAYLFKSPRNPFDWESLEGETAKQELTLKEDHINPE